MWEWRKGRELEYLYLPKWQEQGIQAGFSSRLGGVSLEPYASLNLGLHVGDQAGAVLKNRETWLKEWGASSEELAIGEQVHGTRVFWVGEEDASKGSRDLQTAVPGTDALLTKTELGLMAFYADCVPLFFYHPQVEIVGIAHAGWKGTAGRIAQRVIEEIQTAGGKPADCWAAIGPSIGPCCYEVDERVAQEFAHGFSSTSFLEGTRSGHYRLDLWEANRQILLEAGVIAENIAEAHLCTACHVDRFFSHRLQGPSTGRMAGWIRRRTLREAND